MHVLTMLSQKGGTGKSTLTAHLAVCAATGGARVLVVDLDPQKSISKWWQRREAENVALAQVMPENLEGLLHEAAGEGYNLTLIDTPPSASRASLDAAHRADYCLIPTKPSQFDIDAMGATVDVAKAARRERRTSFVLNLCPPRRGFAEPQTVREARALLASAYTPIRVSEHAVTQRAAFAYALEDGRAVTEYDPRSKASDEIRTLWRDVEAAMKEHA